MISFPVSRPVLTLVWMTMNGQWKSLYGKAIVSVYIGRNMGLTGLQLPVYLVCQLDWPMFKYWARVRWSWSPGYMNNIDYLESLSNHNIICKECCNTTHYPPLPPSHPAHLVNINISLLRLAHRSQSPYYYQCFLHISTITPLHCQSWQLPPESLDKASLSVECRSVQKCSVLAWVLWNINTSSLGWVTPGQSRNVAPLQLFVRTLNCLGQQGGVAGWPGPYSSQPCSGQVSCLH